MNLIFFLKRLRKTICLFFFITIFNSNYTFSQTKFVTVNLGYATGTSKQNISFLEYQNVNFGNNSVTFKEAMFSLGGGLNFGCAFGFMLNKNLGFDLGLSYLLGSKSTSKRTSVGRTIDYTLSANFLRFSPNLILATEMEKIKPYAKFGLVLGMGSVNYENNDNNNGDVDYYKIKMNGGLSIGINSSVGINYDLNDKISFFSEVNSINMAYAPKKGEIVNATNNGADYLSSLTTNEKEIEFVDSFTYLSGNPQPDSEPTKELKQRLAFGSIGINIGIKFKF